MKKKSTKPKKKAKQSRLTPNTSTNATKSHEVVVDHSSDRKISAKTHKYCFSCGRQAFLQVCSGCGKAGYCSRECQKSDWESGGHRYRCKNEPVPVVFLDPVIRLRGVDVVPVPQTSVDGIL